MRISHLDIDDLRFFSPIIKDYLKRDPGVKHLYNRYPDLSAFKEQIKEKELSFNSDSSTRQTLHKVLTQQYSHLKVKAASINNIDSLLDDKTFTVTTGHQLNLFTGPLYFLYKIVSTINLCKQLSQEYPENRFVPIYWMATEDHDFEEIQFFNYGDRKIVYDRDSGGAVGRMDLNGMGKVLSALDDILGLGENAEKIRQLFKVAYLNSSNLAAATRVLAHELFKEQGLVILDADDAELKSLAAPYFAKDLIKNVAYQEINKTLKNWDDKHGVQVNPREINLFYLTDDHRGRIIYKDGIFTVDGLSDLQFTKAEILKELQDYPSRFSPNVILRPLYQEVILPNLCYIGGGGEIAYWLELKHFFNASRVTFPMLLLRNSALVISSKQRKKLDKLDLEIQDLFKKPHKLADDVAHQISEIEIDFSKQKQHLRTQFQDLYDLAHKTEKSFKTAVAAQEQKQINGLEYLEKRLLRAQKRKLSDHIKRAQDLQEVLFPAGTLQERYVNFSLFYKQYGDDLFEAISDGLDPLDSRFTIIEL